jgi:predicted phage terminase large subunit-like protein
MAELTLEQVRQVDDIVNDAMEMDLADARNDPNLFCEWVLKDRLGDRVVQAEIHRLIQDFWSWCVENKRYGLVLAPWGHGKSEQTPIARTLYELGRDPSLRIKIVCNTTGEAQKRVISLRRYLEHSKDLRRVFPNLRLGTEETSTSRLTVERPGFAKDASIEAYGILSTGIGSRCDMLLFDDIVDMNNAISKPANRNTVKQAAREGYIPRLESDGVCLWIQTVWHVKDATMDTLKAARAGHGFAAMVIRVSEDIERLDIEVANAEGFDAPATISLWDAQWSKENLIHRRDEQALGAIGFARGYQQRAISDEDALFRDGWFREAGVSRFHLEDEDPVNYDCFCGVDPAISSRKTANEFALAVVGRHKGDKKLRLLHRVRKKGLSVKGQALAIIHAFDKFRMVKTRIENNAYQEALRQRLEELAQENGIFLSCEGVPSTKDKALYIGAWSPLVESGRFEIDADRFPDVVEDAITFPLGDADMLDAISRATQAAASGPAVFLDDEDDDGYARSTRGSSWKRGR